MRIGKEKADDSDYLKTEELQLKPVTSFTDLEATIENTGKYSEGKSRFQKK